MKSEPNVIISSCGISLASNAFNASRANYPADFNPYQFSNLTSLEGIEHRDLIEAVCDNARTSLNTDDLKVQRRLSAELNALWAFYGDQLGGKSHDIHYLIHTDTWLGTVVAEIIAGAMEQHGLTVILQKIDDLRTSSLEDFRNGTGSLVGFMESILPQYRQSHKVVFNLSGGFKSVQGVMQSMGSVYADEVVYIFEGSDQLLRIPRLPMTLDWDTIELSLTEIRRLSMGLTISESGHEKIPHALLYQLGDDAELSEWGRLIFCRIKAERYPLKLHKSPSTKIIYGDKFTKSLSGLNPDRIKQVNERIDDLALFVDTGKNVKRLDFKQLKGKPYPGSTHEIDATSDIGAKRIYCHYEGANIVLDAYDKHL